MNTRRLALAFTGLVFLLAAGLTANAAAPSADAASLKAGSVEATLSQAFSAALEGDFDAYLKTLHPDERSTATQRSNLKRYSWKRFQKQASWYLTGKDASSFEITKRKKSGDDKVKVMVKDQEHKNRMPVPVRLKRLADGKSWGIIANSL